MMMERALKILMTGGLAVFCALVAIGNIRDPDLNERFLQHVLSMDTVGGPIAVHGVKSPLVWEMGFWSIVAGEALTAAFFVCGTVELLRARLSKARVFHEAKRFVYAGAGCAFLIWFVGFSAVAGNGSRCGSLRSGTVRWPPFVCSFPFSWSRSSLHKRTARFAETSPAAGRESSRATLLRSAS